MLKNKWVIAAVLGLLLVGTLSMGVIAATTRINLRKQIEVKETEFANYLSRIEGNYSTVESKLVEAEETIEFYKSSTPIPTNTPAPTYTKYPTQTPHIVTATYTATPKYTPTETLVPTATLNPLEQPKSTGYYIVGEEIAPGLWRSNPDSLEERCYAETLSRTGDLLSNVYTSPGVTFYIPSSAFAADFMDCGPWTFLGE
jgi:hypothetical protein